MESPSTSRKQLVLSNKKGQSLPPNMRWAPVKQSSTHSSPRFSRSLSVESYSENSPLRQRPKISLGRSLTVVNSNSNMDKSLSSCVRSHHSDKEKLKVKPYSPAKQMKRTEDFTHTVISDLQTNSLVGTIFRCGLFTVMFATIMFMVACFIVFCAHIWAQVVHHRNCFEHSRINVSHFEEELSENLFGQHIAKETIVKAIPEYVNAEDVLQPLVLVMSGWTGVGKNHISNLIASEMNTASVSKLIIPLHFPHETESEQHFHDVQEMIKKAVRKCSTNLIIIDEIDKASSGVIYGLITALNKLTQTMKSNGARVVILILSNSFGQTIANYVYKETIVDLRRRESLTYDETTVLFKKENAGSEVTWYSALRDADVINYTIPFLPLMKSHVHLCVYRDLRLKGIPAVTPVMIERIADELSYYPDDGQIFSKTGCKRVSDKVNFIVN